MAFNNTSTNYNMPMASIDEFDADASPARGKAMRQNLLSKLRSPPFVHSWEFWHDRQDRDKREAMVTDSRDFSGPPPAVYGDRLKLLTTISDVRAFWSMFNNFDITSLPLRDSIHLFHKGVKPVWEDPRNAQGGSWTFRVPKDKAVEFWKEICMLAIGEKLQEAVASTRTKFIDDICGISLSVRFTSILVQIWNRDAEHVLGIEKLLETVKEILPDDLKPKETASYYKKHASHAGFNRAQTSKVNGPNSANGPSLTRPEDMPDRGTVPPMATGEKGVILGTDHQRTQQWKKKIAPPGVTPTIDTGSGFMQDGEALQDIEETLGAMSAAFDRVGGPDPAPSGDR